MFSSFKQDESKTLKKQFDPLQKAATVSKNMTTLFRSNTSSKPVLLSSLSN
jgi:hypothetical protein